MPRRMTVGVSMLAALPVLACAPAFAAGETCGFARAFNQPDEQGTRTVHVYRGQASPRIGGASPLAFVVPDVKVNTDGTRISYNADDPAANTKAINNIRNAYHDFRRPIADFVAVRDAEWKPTAQVWRVLSPSIIEKDMRPGREGLPCIDDQRYLVSMTAIRASNSGSQGDCDQSKWVDALTVPTFVVPSGSQFASRGATVGNVVVGLTLGQPRRIVLGIVGDIGPSTEIGEASVEMNRILNGLPDGALPATHREAETRFQGPRTAFVILPGHSNRMSQPINADTVKAFAGARFAAWGGQERLEACLTEIPEAR